MSLHWIRLWKLVLLGWQAGEKAVTCGVKESGKIEELQVVKDLHKTYSSPGYFFHTSGVAFVSAESAWSLFFVYLWRLWNWRSFRWLKYHRGFATDLEGKFCVVVWSLLWWSKGYIALRLRETWSIVLWLLSSAWCLQGCLVWWDLAEQHVNLRSTNPWSQVCNLTS